MATKKPAEPVFGVIARGLPGKKKFTLDKKVVTRTKAKDVLGPLFTQMDNSKKEVDRRIQRKGIVNDARKAATKPDFRTAVPIGTTTRTKSKSPKAKSIKKKGK